MARLHRRTRWGRQTIEIDEAERRQKRMVRRIRAWWRALDGYSYEKLNRMWMITLTYRPDEDWQPRHVTEFIQKIRNEATDAYCWVAAVQPKTGRMHYHILWAGARPAWVDERWGRGRTQVRRAWSPGYLLKYFWEQDVDGMPKGARRFATWVRKGLLSPDAMWCYKVSYLPPWVAAVCEVWGGLAKKIGGGWWEFDNYLILKSEWSVDIMDTLGSYHV